MTQGITVEVVRHGHEVALSGLLDSRSAPGARSALHAAVDDGTGELVVEVSRLEIWDAAGLGVLVGAHRRARRQGRRLLLSGVPPREARLLRATRLDRLLGAVPQTVV
jgi:anti-anti-sigma factor